MIDARQILVLNNGNFLGKNLDLDDCGDEPLAPIIKTKLGRKDNFNVRIIIFTCREFH